MPEHTTTIWTCSRCGVVEECEGTGQPELFVRVFFSSPPRNGTKVTVGELCNQCGGYIVDFMTNKEQESIERDKVIADIEARLKEDEKPADDVADLWGGS